MALKYFSEYLDPENVEYRIEIDNPGYTDPPIEIGAYAVLEYAEIEEITDPIRGLSLKLTLEADTALTFEDLYEEEEKVNKVTLIRDGQIIFVGWINPDGIYQDWVNDKWNLELDCSDGLSYLENLSYVETTNVHEGKRANTNRIVAIILQQTGLQLPINVKLTTRPTGVISPTETLIDTSLDQNRFIKPDQETPMNCYDALQSILYLFRAVIFQYNGEWYIIEIRELTNGNIDFFQYDYQGNIVTSTATRNMGSVLGSQINNFYPHHCNGNQKIELEPTVSAYRLEFEYGIVKEVNLNPDLEFSVTGGVVDVFDWTEVDPGKLDSSTSTELRVEVIDDVNHVVLHDDSFSTNVPSGSIISVRAEFFQSEFARDTRWACSLSDGVDTYYLDTDETWQPAEKILRKNSANKDSTVTNNSEPTPITGQITLWIYSGQISDDPAIPGEYTWWKHLSFGITSNENVIGEEHTFRRISKPTSIIKSSDTVHFGDAPADLFTGTIYLGQLSLFATEEWTDTISGSNSGILEDMGNKTMIYNYFPSKLFTGDIYGYISYLGNVQIDGINGNFLFKKYTFNTKTNVGEVVLRDTNTTWHEPANIEHTVVLKDERETEEPTV